MITLARRAVATVLSSALILVSPGLSPYEAAAAQFSSKAGASAPAAGPKTAAPLPGAIKPVAGLNRLPATGSGQAATPLPRASDSVPASRASAAARTEAVAAQVAETVQEAGPLEAASDGRARDVGVSVERLMVGERVGPLASGMDSMSERGSEGFVYAKPAGRDSIGAPAAALFKSGPRTEGGEAGPPSEPPQPPSGGGSAGGGSGGDGFERAPLVPRVLTSLAALAPAALLGWPLLAPALTLTSAAGGLIIAISGLLALTPFMNERWPKAVRAAPGALLVALGAVTLAVGVPALALNPVAMGSMVALGGWGFVRFALGRSDEMRGSGLLIATFAGGAAAVTGAGLALLAPAGLLAGAFLAASYVGTLVLFMHLPGWVGSAIKSAARAVYVSVDEAVRVMTSLHRDTSLGRRLERYTSAAIERSAWNALWVGLTLWVPVLVVEGVKLAFGLAVGAVRGALQAPVFALWGASARIAPQSRATRYFAGWAGMMAFVDKPGWFNAMERPFIRAANEGGWVKRHAAAVAITIAQLAWSLLALVMNAVALASGGLVMLFEKEEAYDPAKHDPRRYGRASDPLPGQVPALPKPEVKAAWPGKTFATLVAVVPLVWFWTALVASGPLGWLTLAALAAIAAMPLMPGKGLDGLIRLAPGTLLGLAGFFGAIGGVKALWAGLPDMGLLIGVSAVAAFAGLGLRGMIESIRDPEKKSYEIDGAPYILGFAAAAALGFGLAAQFTGLDWLGGRVADGLGVLGVIASPALLYHLPRYFWSGVWRAVRGSWKSLEQLYEALQFWREDSRFGDNLGAWFRHWTRRSYWYAPMFVVPAALYAALALIDLAVGAAAGAAVALFRAPTRFMAGAAHRRWQDAESKLPVDRRGDPEKAWWPRFWREFDAFLIEQNEGAKARVFDKQVRFLIPLLDDKSAKTSRPTLMAVFGVILAHLANAYWLVRVAWFLLLTPAMMVFAAVAAKKKADSMGSADAKEKE